MELKYSAERAAQILVSLLKQHNIKKVVASPGTTNMTFLVTAMHGPWFEIYSSVDERSAAYIACGLAEESHEPVVLSCTGATASRNYMPGLTEAYYRQLPILAVTASQNYDKVGHLSPQLIDRSTVPNDVARRSFAAKVIKDADDEWADEIIINNAILELKRHGGGPVHLNFQTGYCKDYSVMDIKPARKIERVALADSNWPELPSGRIGIFVGSHTRMSDELTEAIDRFCGEHDALVFCDHTSNYYGKYRVAMSLPFEQQLHRLSPLKNIDLVIHIGGVSGDYPSATLRPKAVWRVNEDGEIRDLFRTLKVVFEMPELKFFTHYASLGGDRHSLLDEYKADYDLTVSQIPELPFSNAWIAQHTASHIPANSIVHLGILNSLRVWNYFPFPEGVRSNCNVGGFGIDGIMSTLFGAALADKNKLCFAILGDLAFFYDMNSLGNRHLPRNMRILMINNGRGAEFRLYNHLGSMFGEESDNYIAAAGHFGRKSPDLVRHYAEDLGFEYFTASGKDEYLSNLNRFLTPELTDRPMLFEVFTESENESNANEMLQSIRKNVAGKASQLIREVMGDKGVATIKKILGK